MFRFSKLYLVAVALLATFLVIMLRFAPRLYDNVLRQNLETESVAGHKVFVQWLQLRDWQRLRWVEILADNSAVAQLLERMERPGTDIPSSAIDELRRAPTRVLTGSTSGEDLSVALSLDMLALISPRREVIGSFHVPGIQADQLGRLDEVDEVFARRSPRRGVLRLQDSFYLTAFAPIQAPDGGLLGVVMAAERLDSSFLTGYAAELNLGTLDILLFGDDGSLVASTLDPDPAGEEIRTRAENYLVWITSNDALPADATRPGDVRFADTTTRVIAMIPGRMPTWGGQPGSRPLGFLLVLSAEAVPESFAWLLLRNPDILKPTRELALLIGLGVALLVIGLVIFELEGRRYRQSLTRLRKQIARISVAGAEGRQLAPEEELILEAVPEPIDSLPQSLPSSTELVDVEAPQPIFGPPIEVEPREPDTVQAVPSRIMRPDEEAEIPEAVPAGLPPGEELGPESPITIQAMPQRLIQDEGELAVAAPVLPEAEVTPPSEEPRPPESLPTSPGEPTGPPPVAAPAPQDKVEPEGWKPPSLEPLLSQLRVKRPIPRPPRPPMLVSPGGEDSLIPPPPSIGVSPPAEAKMPPPTGVAPPDSARAIAVPTTPPPVEPEAEPFPPPAIPAEAEPSPPPAIPPEAEPGPSLSAEEVRALFDEYRKARRDQGRLSESMTLERFREKLRRNEEQVLKTYACKGVRFEVGLKDGKVVVKAIPVR